MTTSRLAAPLALLLLASAASAGEAPPSAAPESPKATAPAAAPPAADAAAAEASVEKLLARELSPLSPRPFSAGLGLEGQAESAAPPVADQEGGGFVIPIGTAEPLRCSVTGDQLDGPATIRNHVELLRDKVEVVLAQPRDAAVAEGRPVFLGEILYKVASPKGPLLGHLKVAVVATRGWSILCKHDEPGYSAAFQRIVLGLARSARGGPAPDGPAPRWADALVVRLGPVGVGFVERQVWDREGGGRIYAERTSLLLPRSATDLAALSEASQEAVAPDGTVDELSYSSEANGESEAQLHLTRQGKGAKTRYAYQGEKSGKKLAGTLEPAGPLASELWFAARLAKGQKVPAAGVRHAVYAPAADPTASVEVRFTLDKARPRGVTARFGPMEMTGTLGDEGLMSTFSIPVGPASLAAERAWSTGAP